MQGLWRYLWVRIFTTALLAVAADILSSGLSFTLLAWGSSGVLDFAGGSVVHVTPMLMILPFWIAAEIKALKTKTPLPLGCYLIFTFVTALGMRELPMLANGFVTPSSAVILSVGATIAAVIIASVPAAIYYLLWHRRMARLPATDVF